MPLETFRGRDLSTVSADVRAAFGDDAMIVETRAKRDGRRSWIEVMAARPDDISRLTRAFAPQAPLHQPTTRKGGGGGRPRIIALVGPTGAGKTTTIAKLAVHQSAFGTWRAGIITLDTFRAGAVEQLQAYADAAELPFAAAYDSQELAVAMKHMADRDVILVDTPGRGPRSSGGRAVWRDLLTGLRPDETHLVVSATTRTDLAEHIRAEYAPLSVTHTLLTKLDEVPHNATLAALASQLALPARWITDGQDVPTDLHGAGPAILGRLGFARATLTPS